MNKYHNVFYYFMYRNNGRLTVVINTFGKIYQLDKKAITN